MFHNSKALINKEPTTDALTPSGPNRNQHDTLQLGNDTIKPIDHDTRGTTPIEKDPTECKNLENSDSEFLNRFICLVKFHSNYFNCNTDNILHFHVNFQQHSVAFIRLLPQYYNKID